MRNRNRIGFGVVIFATLAACSSGGGGDASRHDAGWMIGKDGGGGGTPDMAMKGKDYPSNQGNQPGDAIINLTMEGYRLDVDHTDATMLTYAKDIKMEDYYNMPKCKCLVLTMGATWCGACNQEQPALIQEVAGDPEFCVLNILQEGPNNGTQATQSDVDAWTARYNQNFYVTKGTAATRNLWQGYGSQIGLPFNLVIRTSDMQIMDATAIGSQSPAIQGFDTNIHTDAMTLCNM